MFQITHSSSKRNMWTQRKAMWVFPHSMAKQTCDTTTEKTQQNNNEQLNWKANGFVLDTLQLTWLISSRPTLCVGRDSLVGTATPYGLDGSRIESRWVAKISAPIQTSPGSNPPLIKQVPSYNRG
jgi:hypothetical protein